MERIQFIDTTLRDGAQSLWAMNIRTGMMLPALPDMDEAGFEAMEFFVPAAQMKKMVRDLKEDPWQWLKLGMPKIKKTKLRLHGGFKGHRWIVPESIRKLMVKTCVNYGIHYARISDPWNDFREVGEEVAELKRMGLETIVNLTYSESPRHTDEYFVERAKGAAATNPYRICFKDVGGLLTPERIRQLVPKIKEAVGDITLEFHAHCNNGLAPLNVLEIVRQGVTHIHTAIPPLANGSSQPSIFNVAKNLKVLGYDPEINLEALKPVEAHFSYIARREHLPMGVPLEYDADLYRHQVPGGMISNLRFQLRKVGMEHRLEEALEETIQVRADFGYPIMVTPISQFVGSQASINVITGERYKVVTDEVIQFALGQWGPEAVEVMDPEVRAKILDRPRAKELARREPPSGTLAELRKKFGGNLTDEELILHGYIDADAVRLVRQAPPPQPYISSQDPLVQLVHELTQIKGKGYISIQKDGLSLKLNALPDAPQKN